MAGRVDLGAGGEIVAELEALIEEHPLREGLWATLITALYRAGRQADALAAYQRVRRLLDDELGVEPGPGLRTLEQQVLQQSPGLVGDGVRGATQPGNLPPLIRRHDRPRRRPGAGRVALAGGRLVTILGPGGVGKTRLALEVAHRLDPTPGGVWLVRLDGVDALDRPRSTWWRRHCAWSAARRLSSTGSPAPTPSSPGQLRAPGRTGGRAGRVDARGGAPAHGAGHEPGAARSGRGAPVRAGPVGAPGVRGAVRAACPAAATPGSCWTPMSRAAVEEICRSLDGLPLAIELAAARTRSLSVRDIARRLDDRFGLLRDPSSSRPERRRALAGAIAWSYDLLFPDDQRALWALSCFVGGASLGGVERVLAALDVPDGSRRRHDRPTRGSLVGDASTKPARAMLRYRLLDSIRLYAGERLRESGRASAALRRARQLVRAAGGVVRGARPQRAATGVSGDRPRRTGQRRRRAALVRGAGPRPGCPDRDRLRLDLGGARRRDGRSGPSPQRPGRGRPQPRPGHRLAAGGAGWSRRPATCCSPSGDLDRARRAGRRPGRRRAGRRRRSASGVRGHPGGSSRARSHAPRRPAWSPTARSGSTGRRRRLCCWVAYGSLMVGDIGTASRERPRRWPCSSRSATRGVWCTPQAMLGAVAQAEHRFADAARTLERAADDVGHARLPRAGRAAPGHPGQGAAAGRRSASRGVVRAGARGGRGERRRSAGRHGPAEPGPASSVDGRHSRAVALWQENERWYAAAGGGDLALLNRCLLAAPAAIRAS